jgi:hypothetical protein
MPNKRRTENLREVNFKPTEDWDTRLKKVMKLLQSSNDSLLKLLEEVNVPGYRQ